MTLCLFCITAVVRNKTFSDMASSSVCSAFSSCRQVVCCRAGAHSEFLSVCSQIGVVLSNWQAVTLNSFKHEFISILIYQTRLHCCGMAGWEVHFATCTLPHGHKKSYTEWCSACNVNVHRSGNYAWRLKLLLLDAAQV